MASAAERMKARRVRAVFVWVEFAEHCFHDNGRRACGAGGRIVAVNEAARRKRAREAAGRSGVDGLLLTHLPDVRYLTGFTGSNGAVALMDGRAALFTDGRYTTQATAEAQGVRVVISKKAAGWLLRSGLLKRV